MKKGAYLATAQHAAGIMPIANQVDAAMSAFQKNPTRQNLKEIITAAIPAFVPALAKSFGKAGGEVGSAVKTAVRDRVAPGVTESPMGAQIPTRSETGLGKAVNAADPAGANSYAQTRTAPAIEQAVGGTVGEGVGSDAKTTSTPDDRMGIKGHANDAIAQAKEGYKYIDEQSGNKLSDAQEAADNSRQDFSKEGRVAFKKALADKAALIDQYRESAAAN